MARPYSIDLRERVVATVAGGQPCRAVAKLFDVSVASVVKWSQRVRVTGSAAAKPMGGKRPYLLEGTARLAAGAARREARSDASRTSGRTLWPGRRGFLRHALALLEARGHQLQKKPSSRPSKTVLISRAAAPGGNGTNPRLIPAASFLSTRHGPRPTWRAGMAGGSAGPRSELTFHTATGGR